jgi:hypothetical protein
MQNNSDLKIVLKKLPLLRAAFGQANKSATILPALKNNGASKTLCVAVDENQVAFGNPTTCEFLGSANTASCRAFIFRNPYTKHGAAMHLTAATDERDLPKILQRLAGKHKVLDLYIFGGDARHEFPSEKSYRDFFKDGFDDCTAQEIEDTLRIIQPAAKEKDIKITIRKICMHDDKLTPNAVIEMEMGEFFFVRDKVIAPYIVKPHKKNVSVEEEDFDAPDTGLPLEVVFDG